MSQMPNLLKEPSAWFCFRVLRLLFLPKHQQKINQHIFAFLSRIHFPDSQSLTFAIFCNLNKLTISWFHFLSSSSLSLNSCFSHLTLSSKKKFGFIFNTLLGNILRKTSKFIALNYEVSQKYIMAWEIIYLASNNVFFIKNVFLREIIYIYSLIYSFAYYVVHNPRKKSKNNVISKI